MDYRYFEELSGADAGKYKESFLDVGREGVEALVDDMRADGVEPDFTVDSVEPVLRWFGERVEVGPVEPEPELEDWVREAMERPGGVLELDEDSRGLAVRAAYYLGQSFVDELPHLEWGIGREDRAEANQPVVTGFPTGADMPPLVVAENILLCARDESFPQRVETAVKTWRKAAG